MQNYVSASLKIVPWRTEKLGPNCALLADYTCYNQLYLLQRTNEPPWTTFWQVSGGKLPPIFAALSDRRYRPFPPALIRLVGGAWRYMGVWTKPANALQQEKAGASQEGLPPT